MELVSIGVTAEIFGVTTQTVRNWSREGKLKAYRTVGNHRRYSLEEIEKIRALKSPSQKMYWPY